MNNDEQLRYPIGKLATQPERSVSENINLIALLPAQIESITSQLAGERKFDVAYRLGGWTARQVIHHLADSHLNAYIRTKWMLTEQTPTIKPYDEKAWSLTPEVSADPMLSVHLLKALHDKWTILLEAIPDTDRAFLHPESGKHVRLDQLIATYAWHGLHHVGHLKVIVKAPL